MNCGLAQAPLMHSSYDRFVDNRFSQPLFASLPILPRPSYRDTSQEDYHSLSASLPLPACQRLVRPLAARPCTNVFSSPPRNFSASFHVPLQPAVPERNFQQIFQPLSEPSIIKKALAIGAVVGSILMTLGAVFAWHSLGIAALSVGGVFLLATGLAAAIGAIQDSCQNFEQSEPGFRFSTISP